jgi:DNA-binding NtrC family response regulator
VIRVTLLLCQSCILVVDDDSSVLRILSKILSKVRSNSYDLAIIDVGLQDMNGLDLLDKINKIAPEMKKIILTGYPSAEDRIKALDLGAALYLSKPIKAEKLIETVKQTIK